MLPALPRARALARRIRTKDDGDLLISAPMVVRRDLAGSGVAKRGKAAYERLLTGYWNVVKRTCSPAGSGLNQRLHRPVGVVHQRFVVRRRNRLLRVAARHDEAL